MGSWKNNNTLLKYQKRFKEAFKKETWEKETKPDMYNNERYVRKLQAYLDRLFYFLGQLGNEGHFDTGFWHLAWIGWDDWFGFDDIGPQAEIAESWFDMLETRNLTLKEKLQWALMICEDTNATSNTRAERIMPTLYIKVCSDPETLSNTGVEGWYEDVPKEISKYKAAVEKFNNKHKDVEYDWGIYMFCIHTLEDLRDAISWLAENWEEITELVRQDKAHFEDWAADNVGA